ncbi:MAG: ATP-binding protein, partial [Deltaproteobacteria bacterium]|nr:ATP-binding protein [Deltaproteobacteria bacterium]
MGNLYEKLGSFYLGREYDVASRTAKKDLVLYDSKDLNTHAVIIGMTGSGKTGLGVSLLEEALIDNIPVIAIDPKGDLTNLSLTFPELKPADFRPWINEQDALTKGLTPDEYAAQQAQDWQKGLADWGQEPERIARLRNAAECVVYTPGSNAGLPISILRNFSPPPEAILADSDLFRERIQTTVTGLLALVGIDSDPVTSREHIFLSNLFETFWSQGKALDLAALINVIQSPPFTRVGVMDLDLFFPPKDRMSLAMRINNLLAAPGFESWMEGEPLDIGNLLYGPKGKPKASIFTISHLSEAQRMFFVTLLLNELLGWMRTQPGTTSLRAILYMDEIFGYFPPVKNPPSKEPLLTLLKQARAFGLGVVLSTQNPVDLDYKGLANAGTWFIGRLQTDGDKQRVLAGLEGASSAAGFARGEMEDTLSSLGKRTFLLHNVHENQPVVFQTRWALSYLRGPMSREQIKTLTAAMKAEKPAAPVRKTASSPSPAMVATGPSPAPAGVETFYLSASGAGTGLNYYPALLGRLDIHFFSNRYDIDTLKTLALMTELEDGPVALDWDNSINISPDSIETEPLPGAEFADLPSAAKRAATFRKWQKDLSRWVRQNRTL